MIYLGSRRKIFRLVKANFSNMSLDSPNENNNPSSQGALDQNSDKIRLSEGSILYMIEEVTRVLGLIDPIASLNQDFMDKVASFFKDFVGFLNLISTKADGQNVWLSPVEVGRLKTSSMNFIALSSHLETFIKNVLNEAQMSEGVKKGLNYILREINDVGIMIKNYVNRKLSGEEAQQRQSPKEDKYAPKPGDKHVQFLGFHFSRLENGWKLLTPDFKSSLIVGAEKAGGGLIRILTRSGSSYICAIPLNELRKVFQV